MRDKPARRLEAFTVRELCRAQMIELRRASSQLHPPDTAYEIILALQREEMRLVTLTRACVFELNADLRALRLG